MKNWIMTAVVSLSVVGFATGASAQDPLSARERDYAEQLASNLGQLPGAVRRIQFPHAPVDGVSDGRITRPINGPGMEASAPAAYPGAPTVNGLAVQLDGVTVERLRFDTPQQAQEHANWLLNGELDTTQPVTGELRGNQIVLVRGEGVSDPAVAKRMTEAAWDGLPAPLGESQAAFTHLPDGTMAVSTTLTDGPLRESVDRAIAAAHKNEQALRENPERGSVTTTPTSAQVAFPSGLRAGLQSDENGASAYVARSPEAEALAQQHLAALGGHPGAATATEGAAKILEDLFR